MAGSAIAGQCRNGPPPSIKEENRLLKIQVQNLTVEAGKKHSGEKEGVIDLTKVATDSTGESAPETTGQKSTESILQEIQKKLKSKRWLAKSLERNGDCPEALEAMNKNIK